MKGFKKQELEEQGFMGRLFGSKPQQNAFAEINNILTEAKSAQELTKDAAAAIFKKWGCKFSDTNMDQRSAIYRKVADNAFSSAQSKDDPILNDRAHMAEILEIPENLCRLADNGAKKSAYFSRCRGLVTGGENLTIAAINELFASASRFLTITLTASLTALPTPNALRLRTSSSCAICAPNWIFPTNLKPISTTL